MTADTHIAGPVADAIERANALSERIDDAAERPTADLAAFDEVTAWIAGQIGETAMMDAVRAPED